MGTLAADFVGARILGPGTAASEGNISGDDGSNGTQEWLLTPTPQPPSRSKLERPDLGRSELNSELKGQVAKTKLTLEISINKMRLQDTLVWMVTRIAIVMTVLFIALAYWFKVVDREVF